MTKILLVEDDKSLREIYGVRLLAEGYDIVSAGDGEEALAMAIKERPTLIISDVMMPKISGFDMLDILHSTTETKDIKVIMMTALSSEDQRARGEALGADRYLVKSQVGIEDVVRAVHEVLGDAPISQPVSQQTSLNTNNPRPIQVNYRQSPPASNFPASINNQNPQDPIVGQQNQMTQTTAPQSISSAPQEQTLPQPTAPFSTPRPANLADRIIHPIENDNGSSQEDMTAMITQELNSSPPLPTDLDPALKQDEISVSIPQAQTNQQPQSSTGTTTDTSPVVPVDSVSFEETPRQNIPQESSPLDATKPTTVNSTTTQPPQTSQQ